MSFEEIMASISQQGPLPNGDGHEWRFRRSGDGWEVEGARRNSARVTASGEDEIRIDGFPGHWGANGRYRFSMEGGTCRLKSDHSNHRLKWKC